MNLPHWLSALLFPQFYQDLNDASDTHCGMTVRRTKDYSLGWFGAITVSGECRTLPNEGEPLEREEENWRKAEVRRAWRSLAAAATALIGLLGGFYLLEQLSPPGWALCLFVAAVAVALARLQ